MSENATAPDPILDRLLVDEVVREWAIRSGVRLREARNKTSFTQEKVAKLAGTTAETLCRMELGQLVPREYLRASVACAVGANVADIWPPLTRDELMRRASTAA